MSASRVLADERFVRMVQGRIDDFYAHITVQQANRDVSLYDTAVLYTALILKSPPTTV